MKLSFLTFYFFISIITVKAQNPLKVSEKGPSSAKITWENSTDNDNALRYRIVGTEEWVTIATGSEHEYRLSNLRPKTHYEYQVKTGSGEWSPMEMLLTNGRPNILVIIADDGRYDNYGVTGGPSWFQTPNINSIANEGVNFKYCFPSFSLCGPSRASIVTGLYNHHNGIVDNSVSDTLAATTVSMILHDSGYYVGWVGKYGFAKFPEPGYDYYFQSATDDYTNTYYNYNGIDTFFAEHKTNLFTEKAEEFLDEVPSDKPFCLFLAHKAPHVPLDPRPEDTSLYTTETMPFPTNFDHYYINFPTYYYICHLFSGDSAEVKDEWLKYLQLVAGVDWSVGEMLNKLSTMGVLDSTLIIYTSDNGLLKGEHLIQGKVIALDESLKLPMFIRYPEWFNPDSSKVITDEMAMNIDIAPTMLDAAGVTSPVPMDGWSMHDLTTGAKQRKEFLYESYNKGEECTPTMHAVRTFDHIYITNSCDHFADEFYDFTVDSLENQNMIGDFNYIPLIQSYMDKLDSLRTFYGDTILVDTVVSCKLYTIATDADDEDAPYQFGVSIYPNPGGNIVDIVWYIAGSKETEISISDMMGRNIYRRNYLNNAGTHDQLYFDGYPNGVYYITVSSGDQQKVIKYVKEE